MKELFTVTFLFLSNLISAQFIPVNFRAFSEGFYRESTNDMIAVASSLNFPLLCDTVVFALIDPMTSLPVYCSKVVLSTDGYGSDSIPVNIAGQMLIPYVRFRNTLGVYSRNEEMINLSNNTFDLTDTGFASMNCNRDYNVAKAYSGDMNGDGFIDPNDYVPYDIDNMNGAIGYLVTDLNGDGFVDGLDFPLFDYNNALGPMDPFWFTCSFTAVNEISQKQFQLNVSPDPAIEFVRIKSILANSSFEVLIYNSNGVVVYTEKFDATSEITINISQFLPGIYFISSPGKGQIGKFVKL